MIKKIVKPSLSLVKSLQFINSCNISIPLFDTVCINPKIIKEDHSFVIEFDSSENLWERRSENVQVDLNFSNNNYTFFNSYITKMDPFKSDSSNIYSIKSSNLKSQIEFDSSHNLRMIIPTDSSVSFHSLFTTYGFDYEDTSSSGLIKCNNNGTYHLFNIKKDDINYLCIDGMVPMELETFYNRTYEILLTLGFITGNYHQGECYILSSNDNFNSLNYIEFSSLRKTITTPYRILETNPYNVFNESIANSKRQIMSNIFSENILNTMIDKCREDLFFQNSLLLILESSLYTLDTQPACLSVALEAICNSFVDKNSSSIKPINDKKVSKKVISELKLVLDNFGDTLSEDAKKILNIKLNNINAPTNRDKLVKPFELLGIELKDYELQAINSRNDFLHCNANINIGISIKNSESDFNKIYFTTVVLIRLLYRLILKQVGYNGYIVNILKQSEEIFGIISEENMVSIDKI